MRIEQMRKEEVDAGWQQIAIEIGHQVRAIVNGSNTIGTEDETGYVLMFFNAQNHEGRSTIVSSCTDVSDLKKLFNYALSKIDGPKAKIVKRETEQ
jgi:hypothetical protein